MVCDHPQTAYRSRERNPETGRYLVTFNPHNNLIEGSRLSLPCGLCMGCRLDKMRDWATRSTHEASMHSHNCFITLTFSNDFLPWNYSIDQRDFQLFMKRLRKSIEPSKVRFFACGEYGDDNLRPHYHALLFGYDFNDKVHWKTDKRGNKLYTSNHLTKLWPYGHSTLGNVNYATAQYVAGYVTKKIGGEPAASHYLRQHPISGKLHQVQPEFRLSSTRPGIGASWFEKYQSDCFPSQFVIVEGSKRPVPRYYYRLLDEAEAKRHKRNMAVKTLKTRREFRDRSRREARAAVRTARMSLHPRSQLKDDDQ